MIWLLRTKAKWVVGGEDEDDILADGDQMRVFDEIFIAACGDDFE